MNAIKGTETFQSEAHDEKVQTSKRNRKIKNSEKDEQDIDLAQMLSQFSPSHQRAILQAKDCLSAWLTMPPLAKDNFDLSPREFQDGLAMRYMKPLQELPPKCDGCRALFTVGHALDCRKGLVVQRHTEVCDTIYNLAAMVWGQITKELVIQESKREQFRSFT